MIPYWILIDLIKIVKTYETQLKKQYVQSYITVVVGSLTRYFITTTLYSNLVIAVDMKAFSALLQKLQISQIPCAHPHLFLNS